MFEDILFEDRKLLLDLEKFNPKIDIDINISIQDPNSDEELAINLSNCLPVKENRKLLVFNKELALQLIEPLLSDMGFVKLNDSQYLIPQVITKVSYAHCFVAFPKVDSSVNMTDLVIHKFGNPDFSIEQFMRIFRLKKVFVGYEFDSRFHSHQTKMMSVEYLKQKLAPFSIGHSTDKEIVVWKYGASKSFDVYFVKNFDQIDFSDLVIEWKPPGIVVKCSRFNNFIDLEFEGNIDSRIRYELAGLLNSSPYISNNKESFLSRFYFDASVDSEKLINKIAEYAQSYSLRFVRSH
ncbi:MAG: hypothetical protein ACRCXZ_07665 [Patescibacteria group bacterium]